MIRSYFLVYIAVVLQSSAKENNFYYIVDNGYVSDNLNHPDTGIGRLTKPAYFQGGLDSYQGEQVKIQLYYECLCPDCRDFDNTQFKQTLIALQPYLDVNVYPYGNAQTIEKDGQIKFICQHGQAECYGNKLHACAIDSLKNITIAVLYNSCMMDSSQAGHGSDDKAADVCGQSMGIDSEPIKECAKGARGTELLKYYGEESKKANFNSVPHILINGVESTGENFMKDVCRAFKNPPPGCNYV